MIQGAKRLENELYSDYKERIKEEKRVIKFRLINGRMFHNTKTEGQCIIKEGAIENTMRRDTDKKKKITHNYFTKKYYNVKSFTQHKLNQGIQTKVVKGNTVNDVKRKQNEIYKRREIYELDVKRMKLYEKDKRKII